MVVPSIIGIFHFNPHSPCGERPSVPDSAFPALVISIHAPRVGSDKAEKGAQCGASDFNPRSPCGERLQNTAGRSMVFNFNPRSPCGERRFTRHTFCKFTLISIHAPRVGSDMPPQFRTTSQAYFNPRSPCGERRRTAGHPPQHTDFNPRSPCGERLSAVVECRSTFIFQSTLPVWGATSLSKGSPLSPSISIHAPRVGSDHRHHQGNPFQTISIHAPRVGSDPTNKENKIIYVPFQSTLPVWGATSSALCYNVAMDISIHAPRVGSDQLFIKRLRKHFISIHAPRVGSDRAVAKAIGCSWISIHAPRVGSDNHYQTSRGYPQDFNPRSPCGERPPPAGEPCPAPKFQSTLPVWGATRLHLVLMHLVRYFNPRSPCGERLCICASNRPLRYFNPRSPCGERPTESGYTETTLSFQSTLPVWGATDIIARRSATHAISIHAPRVGSDAVFLETRKLLNYFNPRSPCGERRFR